MAPADGPDLLLVDNLFEQDAAAHAPVEFVPHLGLMRLAAVVRQAGRTAGLFDPKRLLVDADGPPADDALYDRAAAAILADRPRVVGFTAYGLSFPFVVEVSRRLRAAAPGVPLIIGGPHATILSEPLLRAFPWIDAVVRYEAEPVIVPLLERLLAGVPPLDVPNLALRHDGQIILTGDTAPLPDLDDLPEPAYDLYPDALHAAEFALESGRGCPYVCSFCSTSGFFKRKYRLRDAAALVDDMTAAHRRWGTTRFYLNHDLFGLRRAHLEEFCRLVAPTGLSWSCSLRVDTLDAAMIGRIAAAGCRAVYFGLETGSPALQKSLHKHIDLGAVADAVAGATAAGLDVTTSFITGFPDEDIIAQGETIDLAGRLLAVDPDRVRLQLHLLSPEPGTPLLDAVGVANLRFDGIDSEGRPVRPSTLVREHPELFSVFWHYPSPTPRARCLLAVQVVNRLVPTLGPRLFVRLVGERFDGRASALVEALAGRTDAAGAADPERLWRRVREATADLADGPGALGEAVRFRLMCDELRDDDAAAAAGGDLPAPAALVGPFRHDVVGWLGTLEGRGDVAATVAPGGHFYALRLAGDRLDVARLDRDDLGPLAAEVARD